MQVYAMRDYWIGRNRAGPGTHGESVHMVGGKCNSLVRYRVGGNEGGTRAVRRIGAGESSRQNAFGMLAPIERCGLVTHPPARQ